MGVCGMLGVERQLSVLLRVSSDQCSESVCIASWRGLQRQEQHDWHPKNNHNSTLVTVHTQSGDHLIKKEFTDTHSLGTWGHEEERNEVSTTKGQIL